MRQIVQNLKLPKNAFNYWRIKLSINRNSGFGLTKDGNIIGEKLPGMAKFINFELNKVSNQ